MRHNLITIGICAWSFVYASFEPAKHPEYKYRGQGKWTYTEPKEFIPDEELGYIQNPNQKVRYIVRTTDHILWDTVLTFDKNGMRIVDQDNLKNRTQFFAFYGCSFVQGGNLNDHETLPYYFAKRIKTHHIYNLAIGGSGPNMMLALIESARFKKIIKEKTGVFAYVALKYHVNRANGFYKESAWMSQTPYYEYDKNNELYRFGTIRSSNPWTMSVYDYLRQMHTKWLPYFDFNWPLVLKKHLKYTCDLIVSAAKKFKAIYPKATFIVINHPMGSYQNEILSCLIENKIIVLSPKIKKLDGDNVPGDGHPTAAFNQRFSEVLAQELKSFW